MQIERYGKYQVVGKIGHGAMGDVFRARDTALNREVAVKTIAGDMAGDETLRRRFLREAQSAAQLNHPSIITVYELGEEQGRVFIAMELLEGRDLKELIGSPSLAGVDLKLDAMEQVLAGVAFAHERGVVHRDLKPANIRVLPGGQVKIMDFGLARLAGSEMTRTGMVLGTPHYMSPEQVRGERVDARSDVFSLGCILYEVLSARKPFDADSMHAVLFKVLQEEPAPIRAVVPGVPVVLEQVLVRSMAKDPALRYQGGGEFLAALRRARQAMAAGAGDRALPELGPLPGSTPASPPSAGAGAESHASRGGPAAEGHAPPAALRARPPAARARSWFWVAGAAVVAVALAAAALAVAWLRSGEGPAAAAQGPAPVDSLARAVASTQIELARRKLEAGDYAEALRQAERATQLDPASEEARAVVEDARRLLAGADRAAAALEEARASGDRARVGDALWAMMAAAPADSRVAALLADHEATFEARARDAERRAVAARAAAEKAGARAAEGFRDGAAAQREAEAAAKAGRFATAARAFLTAADRFGRAAAAR